MLIFFTNKSTGHWRFLNLFTRANETLEYSHEHGFTLLEVLVAVVILGTALAVLLAAVNKNLILASKSKNLTIAGILAQKKLTEIELEGFPEIREEKGEFEEAPGFNWFLSIRPFEISQLGTEIRVVRLLIIWDEGEKDFEVTLAVSELE
jgi:general secretion pathway protein I